MAAMLSISALVLLAAAWALRHHIRNRPPAPSAFSLQLATRMTGATFQLPGSAFSLPYRLYVPPSLEPGRRYPMIVYLHGAGDNGNDNVRQLGSIVAELLRRSSTGEPVFILAPQAPWGENWVGISGPPFLNYSQRELPQSEAVQATRALALQLPTQYPVDPDRLYVLGFSAGSAGGWDLMTRGASNPFAAGALLSGAYDTTRAPVVAATPLWFFHGEQDTISPFSTTQQAVDALRLAGGQPRFTLCTGVGHDTSEAAFTAGVYDWLLHQRRYDVTVK